MHEHGEEIAISVHDLLAVMRLTGEARQELLTIRELIREDAPRAVHEAIRRGLEELAGIDRITAAWYREASKER